MAPVKKAVSSWWWPVLAAAVAALSGWTMNTTVAQESLIISNRTRIDGLERFINNVLESNTREHDQILTRLDKLIEKENK